jgi:hypothetical protein
MIFERTDDFKRSFKRLAKRFPSLGKDLGNLLLQLQEDPFLGESLGDNCYKIRLAIKSKNKGKIGGARVLTCVKIVNDTIHLLDIYDKSEIDNVSDEYLAQLRKDIE